MIRALLSVRFRGLFSSFVRQGGKKRGNGMLVLFAFLYLYLIVVVGGVMCFAFSSLAEVYHAAGLDWLYFAIAGLMAGGLAIFGSVFSTQSQLYDAKDNETLLAMPIPPRDILLTRMVPLMVLNLIFSGIVMIPAIVMYAILVEASGYIVLQILAWLLLSLPVQAIACLLGWLLHLLLQKANKSVVSIAYTVIFLVAYFYLYSQAQSILQSIAANGEAIAATLYTWVWPFYALGSGCLGNLLHFLAYALICGAVFAVVCYLLSATFLHTATATVSRGKKRKVSLEKLGVRSPIRAVVNKELKKFVSTPVYLTNMGIGLVIIAALPVLALVFRGRLLELVALLGIGQDIPAMMICAMLLWCSCMSCVSTPSVSLEGKSLWVMKSMPISSRSILLGKLYTHFLLTVPVSALSGLLLGVILECNAAGIALCAVIPALSAVFSGLFGMWAGLKWAKLDYISEAYPCKQGAAVCVTMFGIMLGLIPLLVIPYIILYSLISPIAYLALCGAVLALLSILFYRIVFTWGIRKWECLN